MPADDPVRALVEAAGLWGVEPGYFDIWGERHETGPEIALAILGALGVQAGSDGDLARAICERERAQWRELAPPTLVISEAAQPAEIPLRIPEQLRHAQVALDLRWESGRFAQYHFRLADLPDAGAHTDDGERFIRKRLPLAEPLPLGYHEVRLRLGLDRGAVTRLIICPDRAWIPPSLARGERRAGLAVSLYGVRSARTWGCGDFTALESVIEWLADRIGGSFVALNPLCAIHNRHPYNTSPYLPNNALYRNFIYLDLERIDDFAACVAAQRLLERPEIRGEIARLNAADLVDYDRVAALKRRFLRLLFRRFYARELPSGSSRAAAFLRYIDSEGELLDRYAVYCAIDDWLHRRDPEVWVWQDWPEEFRDPESKAVERFAESHRRSVLFHKYVQWQIDLQLEAAQNLARRRGLEIGLFHDLPLAIDRCGAQFWAHRDFYVSGCRVGAPPDGFSPKGQDWAFPPPNRDHHFRDGYRFFADGIRKSVRHGGALRIDHVMRFFRLFWIPDGMDATQGAYVKDYFEDLLRILALESVRRKVLLVGEDLGTVEPSVRRILRLFGILSYRVFYFEKNDAGDYRPPDDYPVEALVSCTTHDLPTLAGFWTGRDIEARREAGLLPGEETYRRLHAERAADKQKMLDALHAQGLLPDGSSRRADDVPALTGDLHNAITGFLASSPCLLMTLNQEDLTKETEQQNLPGTVHQYPNWRRKMRFTVEDLHTSRAALDYAAMFRYWVESSGRRN
ncbi:MAG: 4-alpha-glucanotransferase [Bryobacteraceae bacterium]